PADNGGGATVDIRKVDTTGYKLSLSKKANSATATPGGPLDFTVTLKNLGTKAVAPGDTLKVTDQLPSGYKASGFEVSAGSYNATTGNWTGLSLKTGESAAILVKGTVEANYQGTNLTNRVNGFTPDKKPIPADNGGGATVDIKKVDTTSYNLSLSKKANSATAAPGGPLDFMITLKNLGTKAVAPGDTLKVTDQLPSGYTASSFEASAGSYNSTTGTWTGLSLKTGESATILVKGTVQANYQGTKLTNRVDGFTPDDKPIPADNGGNATVEIVDDLFVPNVITPNGDGVNDVLRIKGLGKYKNPELIVINRWNNLVYRNNNYDNTWNGSGLQEGTYFYVLTVTDDSGKVIRKRGYVMVLR
ncbi:gliding motility-associated C-terminal domain-containing protein, partial [Chitinophaga sp. YIM B06452]|uniref:T9SS type B sorting domain-containing protein n=1 Tax=Chitinophaga sp. YIM B06452 TaxID=3082158 RepID=UPI0031FF2432